MLRAARLGGGPALAGRRCFVLDVSEAAAAAEFVPAAAVAAQGQQRQGHEDGVAGLDMEAGVATGGLQLPVSAWVEARAEAWDEGQQLLLVSGPGPSELAREARWCPWGVAANGLFDGSQQGPMGAGDCSAAIRAGCTRPGIQSQTGYAQL
jgi:hypothetical protein